MADVTAGVKKLTDELDVINNSLKGRKTIECAKVLADIPTNNSKEDMFGVIKELYNFSKKVLTNIGTASDNSIAPAEDIKSLIKQQLTDVLPGLLKEALENHSASATKMPQIEMKDTRPSTSHTLLVENMVSEENEEPNKMTEQEWTTIVKQDVQNSLKSVPVMKANPLVVDGAAKLHFKSKEHMDQAQEALKSKYKLTPKTEERKRLDPKLTISDISTDITSKEDLEEKLLEKNGFIKELKDDDEMFKIVFFDKRDKFAVLQVSAKIREAIRQNRDRVFVDLEQHQVRDRVHVVQCFHCQGYGHMSGSPYCGQKDSDPTCFYCAGSHASKDCNRKKEKKTGSIKCINCEKSKNHAIKSKCNTHKASDNLCPFYVKEKIRIMSRTDGYSEESKNNYLQRVKEQQARRKRV